MHITIDEQVSILTTRIPTLYDKDKYSPKKASDRFLDRYIPRALFGPNKYFLISTKLTPEELKDYACYVDVVKLLPSSSIQQIKAQIIRTCVEGIVLVSQDLMDKMRAEDGFMVNGRNPDDPYTTRPCPRYLDVFTGRLFFEVHERLTGLSFSPIRIK
jgi:hypothetical protein